MQRHQIKVTTGHEGNIKFEGDLNIIKTPDKKKTTTSSKMMRRTTGGRGCKCVTSFEQF